MRRRVLVTAALPYANDDIHIGHITSTYLPADIYTRYLRLRGAEVIYVCGSDDHGTPIALAAKKRGVTPYEHASYYRERHIRDFKRMGIEFDIFYRTHSPENEELVRNFLIKAREKGLIYKKGTKQYRCPNCKMYLPDRFVIGTCPFCGAPNQYGDHCEVCGRQIPPGALVNPRCAICGTPAEVKDVTHFFFKLSALEEDLRRRLLTSKPHEEAMNYVLRRIEEGLKDRDISRENYRGFKMPFEDANDLYVYVRVDAPWGYVAATRKRAKEHGYTLEYRRGKDSPTEIVHFIGKDIIYHHFLFRPAMLMVSERFKLPTRYAVNGFLLLEGKKMSKSRGRYIKVSEITERYDHEYVRFYLAMKARNRLKDENRRRKDFQERINSDLIGNIGNLIHRVNTLAYRILDGTPRPEEMDEEDKEIVKVAEELLKRAEMKYEAINIGGVIDEILRAAGVGNSYLAKKEPRKNKSIAPGVLTSLLYLNATIVTVLHPIMPEHTRKIRESRGLKDFYREVPDASKIRIKEKPKPPFKKISVPEAS